MQFDSGQQQAIEIIENVVVAAGAGSGKTTVLAERYLRLVRAQRAPVGTILTLTFTRKAAAEMHERIYQRLRQIDDDPFIAEQLEQFDRAPISTLDSFCAQLVRSSAARFGVSPDFRSDEEEHRRLADEVALDVLLDHLAVDAVARFTAANDFEKVWRECLVSIAEDYCLITRPIDAADIAERQHATLMAALNAGLDSLCRTVTAALALDIGTTRTALQAVEGLQQADLQPHRNGAGLRQLQQRLEMLRNVKKPGGGGGNAELVLFKEHLDLIRTASAELLELVGSLLMENEVRALLEMVADFDTRLQSAKRARGLLTYADVMEMSIATLQHDAELRRYYNRRFRFIMIDEFQDNNQRQKQLLYLLALSDENLQRDERLADVGAADLAPRKLFFVGDEKQSIYRFRGADVSVFKQLAGELAAASGCRPVELSANYRSEPQLIDFFNRVFPGVMANEGQPWEADFSPLQQGAAHRVDPSVRLLFKPYRGSAADSEVAEQQPLQNEDAEAFCVARWIHQAVSDRSLAITDGDEIRAAGFDDIALLLRSSGNQMRFERMFRRFGIPYQSQVVRSLFLEAPAYDIYQLLQLACYPEDRQAYAALLRSPLVNLSDDALVTVLLRHEAPFVACAELSAAQKQRYSAAAELYSDIAAQIDRVSASQLVSRIWYYWGYRYALLRSSAYHPYLEYYEHLFALARRYDGAPLVEFLDVLRANLGQYGRLPELEVIQEHGRGVQIMTVHKAKGLEFPVVILGNSGNAGRSEGTGSAPFYLSQQHGLTFNMPVTNAAGVKTAVNWFFTQGRAEEKRQELAEAKRLLYVALTRARCHLLITGYFHRNNQNAEHVHLRMLLNALDVPQDGSPGGRPHPIVTVEQMPEVTQSELTRHHEYRSTVDGPAAARRYQDLPVIQRAVARREYSATELNALAPESGLQGRTLSAIESDRFIEEYGLEQSFGTLCHAAIEHQLRRGHPPAAEELQRAADTLLAEASAAERTLLLADALRLSHRFFGSPEYQQLVGAVDRARYQVEHAFVLCPQSAPGIIVHGQIDLFVPHAAAGHAAAGGVLIDFKTNRCAVPGEYALQLALYREAAEALFGSPVAAWVCYLRDALWLDYRDAHADPGQLLRVVKRSSYDALWQAAQTGEYH